MAKSLNKKRMRDSRLALLGVLGVVFFTKSVIDYDAPFHEILEFVGYFLVALCALGRVYSTAFLGGFKNEQLVTHGPFSVTRNPLYFFSFLGMTGIGFISGHLVLILVTPVFFLALYHFLIAREEAFLTEKFGESYRTYTASTPRFFPSLSRYHAPEIVEVSPRHLKMALLDALWWFVAFPVFEFAEALQEDGILKPLLILP